MSKKNSFEEHMMLPLYQLSPYELECYSAVLYCMCSMMTTWQNPTPELKELIVPYCVRLSLESE